ncbi:MAG: hypothetical protein LC797_15445 [Chloroflexi bacterium]|nr:hypothetical protein [Chloroflexota bacterium]
MLPERLMLVTNQEEQAPEWGSAWEEPDALADIAFVAGLFDLEAMTSVTPTHPAPCGRRRTSRKGWQRCPALIYSRD